MTVHWSHKYIGLFFVETAFDCAVLVQKIQQEVFGREAPIPGERWYSSERGRARLREMAHQIHECRSLAQEVTDPQDGDVVLLRVRGNPSHLGTYCVIEGEPWVLHMTDGQQSVLQRLTHLRLRGYDVLGYFRPVK